jgi:DnaJ homologue, subfamily C, member 28, conserved domain
LDVAFEKIAQQKIQEAIDAGEFDNLPNAGEKLDLESYFALPPHLRMAYSVLKSANCVPQEVDLLNDLARLEAELARTTQPDVRVRLTRELEHARLRLNVALDRLRTETPRST